MRRPQDSSPLVDEAGVTFWWDGDAEDVAVVGSWCSWQRDAALPMHRQSDGSTWSAHLSLGADAYVEYAFVVDGVARPDPGNPNRTHNGFDGWNSQLWMPRASRRAVAMRRAKPRGRLERTHVELGWFAAPPRRRRVDLYLPPGPRDPADLPLLVVLDGPDYLERGRLDRILDALITGGWMAPLAAAFVANAGPARGSEYAGNDSTVGWLVDAVVPFAGERLGLGPQGRVGGPGRAAILGSSAGGWMGLHAAVRASNVFGRAILQSVATDYAGVEATTLACIIATPPGPARLWLDAGDHEWLAEPGDRLAELLLTRGYDVTYRRHHGGHDQTSWTESLVDALPTLFPPT